MTASKFRYLLAILNMCLIGVTINNALGCTVGRFPGLPPPPLDWDGKFRWTPNDVVMFGVVDSVDRNVDMTWVERQLIEWRVLNQPHNPSGLTPLHRIKLREVRYFAGSGAVSVTVELKGCGLPIPKPGEHALLFSEGTGKERSFSPLYESDREQFTDSLKRLEQARQSSTIGTH